MATVSPQPQERPFILGLTGSLGSGKSFVASLFRKAAIPVVCADSLAREATERGRPELASIAEAFGSSVLEADGSLNRRALADLVFYDAAQRKRLEEILHPSVRTGILQFIAAHPHESLLVCDVPLLYESHFDQLCDECLVVVLEDSIRNERLQRERGMTLAQIQARLAQQLPQDVKRRRAHHLIDNSGTRQATCQQLRTLLQQLYTRMKKSPPPLCCDSL